MRVWASFPRARPNFPPPEAAPAAPAEIPSAATAAARPPGTRHRRRHPSRSERQGHEESTTRMSSWDEEDSAAAAAAEAASTDVELLKRAWRNEKAAPEILRFDSSLVSRVREQIQLLEETLDDFADSGVDDLVVSLYQMDLDRSLFLLRSYLRLRLQKIEKYTMHISRSDDLLSRLSQQERRFAKSCAEIMEKHLEQSVLSKLPYGYDSVTRQSLSSTEDDMVPEPQLDTFVFCKTKSDVGAFQLDDIGEEVVDLVADDLYVLRYKSIKGLVENGRIDLI